ncbi:MAG: CAP domain-containing protein [Chloroflexota bacterium]|nr:MAG: CAP domain-containing protein [Chloroflexota bacterium]
MTESRSRIVATILSATLLLLLQAGTISATPPDEEPDGTIRGGVYEDVDGDGHCKDDVFGNRRPVPGIDVQFTSADASVMLSSGANGTFGLIPVAPGAWQVQVMPDATTWLATSANPLIVEVTAGQDAVQTEVNFCLLRIGGPGGIPLPEGVSFGEDIHAAEIASAGAQTERDATAVRAIISEILLTNPPAPRPPENLEETLEIPVDENATPAAEWLRYLNLFRQIGDLPPLSETEQLTFGSQWHSRYMVVNDTPIAHSEDEGNALYDPAGDQAARQGNIFSTPQLEADFTWPIHFWISAPFHLVPIIDPALETVGFGAHNQEVGNFRMASVLDVRSELTEEPVQASYPIYFPADGAATWVVRHSLYEWPNPMSSCPGYTRPSGPPLVLQLGDGSLQPSVSSHAVYADGQLLESCLFDETSYSNPDPWAQRTGRVILDERDAVVIIPRHPLAVDATYQVEVTADGQLYSWQFTTQRGPEG